MAAGDVLTHPRHTGQWANGRVRVISDAMILIDPSDCPLVERIGLSSGNSKFNIKGDSVYYEWTEDFLYPRVSTITDATGIDGTVTTITLADAICFVGDVVKIGDEFVLVTAAASPPAYTVIRGYWGSTAVAHASGADVEIVSMNRNEGAAADSFGFGVEPGIRFNTTSILYHGIYITRTMADQQKLIGINDLSDQEGDKAMKLLMEKVEMSWWYSKYVAGSGITTPRSMGGIHQFLTSSGVYKNFSNSVLDYYSLEDLYTECAKNGSRPDLMVCNLDIYKELKRLVSDDITLVENAPSSVDQIGRGPVRRIEFAFGGMEILPDRLCPSGRIYMFNTELMGGFMLNPITQEQLPKDGDRYKSQIIYEGGFVMAHPLTAHAWAENIALSS